MYREEFVMVGDYHFGRQGNLLKELGRGRHPGPFLIRTL